MDYNLIKKEFLEDIKEDLGILFKSLNYAYDESSDSQLLQIIAMNEIKTLLIKTNQNEIPVELREHLTRRMVGKFLNFKHSNNLLGDGFDFESSIKSIQEGSFKYEFSEGISDEEKFLMVIHDFMKGDNLWVNFRKFKW